MHISSVSKSDEKITFLEFMIFCGQVPLYKALTLTFDTLILDDGL